MGEIEWAMWANEQAIIGAAVLLIGGLVGVVGFFHNWEFAAYSIPIAILILLLEYPRSKRKKGHTVERKYQKILVPAVNVFGPITKNYYARCIIHLILCVPSCFVLPTVLGAMCLMVTAIIYLVAAIKGEEWRPLVVDKTPSKFDDIVPSISQPPCKPPPRGPTTSPLKESSQSHLISPVHAEQHL